MASTNKLILFFICSLLLSYKMAMGNIPSDKVETLPGFEGPLPSDHFSGYIPVGDLSGVPGHLHYWFISSEQESAATDPVVLWLNGGPGSSSLIGLLTENGQLRTNDDSLADPTPENIPRVFYNPYSWTRVSNMLYLESPKGVGFSYCDNATSSAECKNDDESTALDAYSFLVNWFAAFPEYKKNKFYITGESYAGIYIPMLMDQIRADSLGAGINLVGAAIGNGCWGTTVGTCAHGVEQQEYASAFYFGHGMYSQQLREEMLQPDACGDWSDKTQLNSKCQEKLDEMNEQMGDFNVYNVYDECGADNRRRRRATTKKSLLDISRIMAAQSVQVETVDSFHVSAGYADALNDYECGGHTAMNSWLAEPSVQAALHVLADTPGQTYTKTCGDLLPLYAELIDRYQMLIYSGDVDGCVPYVGSEQWTRGLNYTVVNDWHQWLASPHSGDDSSLRSLHKAGYAINFDSPRSFQFVTVNGAGHEVPTFQPSFAYELYRKFLAGEVF